MVVCYIVLFFMALVSSAYAGGIEYYCTVKQVLKLSDEGKIVVDEVKSRYFFLAHLSIHSLVLQQTNTVRFPLLASLKSRNLFLVL
jgi:hypothetical protein